MQTILTDFYTLNSSEKAENGSFVANISLNKDHDIFKGHFPGNPVTPGVCMMQIVKELTEEFTGKKLFLKSASNVKFMAIINPFETPDLVLQLDINEGEEEIKVKNTTSFGETIALKMSVNYKK
ncbi:MULTISPECIES: 3-hydroxyacyl-ACP dehydratase [Chryseobacterium]|uniref:3-hydroxyacyl-ACP dehydratase n=1 Tax=Chryseobacterium TaxID=59732 RepID=UPI00195D0907|nr:MULTISPECIES: 3-hydroxyacyl-ACP dehydratase [Chryseobacterium]MBM7418460.1 3-hydroxyacyl-[acyl-carrier-protein] dehydratase [Chryseobacterium sp. JUb44]MDH6212674.1 3-hydroxyacyl-[acyl-carrier-protein] dehydratase [Chryseobacterium sp. BIGb0186]WSO11264.1 3-hydroxyacyl-ACP dehydratase [Chryseobacterium scophthalmum]